MAKDKQPEGTVPAMDPEKSALLALLEDMRGRLAAVENRERLREEALLSPTKLIDQAWEAWKAEAGRPASERTQDIADRRYGTDGLRFKVALDPTTEDGKRVNCPEHFPLTLSANSDLEAQARYLDLMGIKKHDYRLACEPAAA